MTIDLQQAILLRNENKQEEALVILKSLLKANPKDPTVNYQTAWTYDSMGKELEAIPYYEAALSNGLVEDRSGAMLGLASTLRCLGEYEKSLKVFEQAIVEFPEMRVLRIFRALTLYNLGRPEETIEQLLLQLIETTSDESINSYSRALRFYSNKLSEKFI